MIELGKMTMIEMIDLITLVEDEIKERNGSIQDNYPRKQQVAEPSRIHITKKSCSHHKVNSHSSAECFFLKKDKPYGKKQDNPREDLRGNINNSKKNLYTK